MRCARAELSVFALTRRAPVIIAIARDMHLRAPILALSVLTSALARPAEAEPGQLTRAEMAAETHGYYGSEMTSAFLFVGVGAAQAGAGAIALTRSGDFAKSFGWTSIIAGGLTALGGGGYGFTVKPRGEHFDDLLAKDPAKFKREELEHIQGTNSRFVLYLGFEITEALAGAGVATYGFIKDRDLLKGIGLGVGIQGLSLFALDLPGALRASSYQDQVSRFEPASARRSRPRFGLAPGSAERPWLMTVAQRF